MKTFRMVQEVYHSYLVMDCNPDLAADDYGLNILVNNELPQFVLFQNRFKDGLSEYYYDVTECCSLENILKQKLAENDLHTFADALCRALEAVEDFLMDENDIVLSSSCIFKNSEDCWCFIYYPGYGQKLAVQLKQLVEQFLTAVDYTDADSVRKAYQLYHISCDENTALKKLHSFSILENVADDTVLPDCSVGTNSSPGVNVSPSAYGSPGVNVSPSACGSPSVNGNHDACVSRGMYNSPSVCGNPETGKKKKMKESSQKVKKSYKKHNISGVCILTAVLMIEAGIGVWAIQNITSVDIRILIGCFAFVAAATLMGGIIVIHFGKNENSEDFWKPEDFVDYEGIPEPTGSFSGERATTLLSLENTDNAAEVVLKSVHTEQWPDLRIRRFPAIIGKDSKDPGLCIRLPAVSRRHARMEKAGAEIRLTDLHSSNGTFVNGELIGPNCPVCLHPGDNVIFADVEFVFELSEAK